MSLFYDGQFAGFTKIRSNFWKNPDDQNIASLSLNGLALIIILENHQQHLINLMEYEVSFTKNEIFISYDNKIYYTLSK